jgi:hypothetical protein
MITVKIYSDIYYLFTIIECSNEKDKITENVDDTIVFTAD